MIARDSVMLEVRGLRRHAICCKVWRRDEGHKPIMSISSGPKDMLVNSVLAVFDARPEVDTVALMSLAGQPVKPPHVSVGPVGLLCRTAAGWTDIYGAVVGVQPA